MTRVAALALSVVALTLPASAFAAKGKTTKSPKLKAGAACTMKKEAMYKAHRFTCVKGHLKVTMHAKKTAKHAKKK